MEVKTASGEGSVRAARRLRPYLSDARWLQKRNRYRSNTIDAIRSDAGTPALSSPHIAAYIAASAPLHCVDGWSLLGKAVSSHTAGDAQSCTHLAYYAELRAAMALLATAGVGVFDTIHFVLDSSGRATKLTGKPTTHTLAWEALAAWSDTSSAALTVSKAVRPYGIPLAEWLAGYPPISTWGAIAAAWLKSWGMDIANYAGDRFARNEASYRPSGLQYRRALPADDAVTFLREFWLACEPGGSPFAPLDRALLRSALHTAYSATSSPDPLEDAVDAVVGQAGLTGQTAAAWRLFLLDEPRHPLLDRAPRTSPPHREDAHLETLSRATLLLRIATGAARDFLSDAGIGIGDLEFWWRTVGEDTGIWEGDPPSDFADLWADTAAALAEIEAVRPIPTYADGIDIARQRTVLGQAERLMLWGMWATP